MIALAFAILLALVAAARLPWRLPAGGQAHLVLAEEAMAAVLVGALALAAAAARLAPTWDRVTGLVAALLGLELASALGAQNRYAAARAAGLLALGAACFALGRGVGRPGRWAPLGAVTLVALSVLAEAMGLWVGASRGGHAPGGLLGQRNAAAQLLLAALPLCAALALDPRSIIRRWALVALGLSTAAITLCRTRSAWLAALGLAGLGAALLLRALLRRQPGAGRSGSRIALAALLGIGAALASPTALRWTSRHPYRQTLAHLLDPRSSSGSGRRVQYAATLRMARAHPLGGVGPGNWSGQYLAFSEPGDPTLHRMSWPVQRLPASDLLGYLAERGAIAFALVLGLAGTIAGRSDPDRWLRRATLLGVAVVAALDAVLQLAPHLLLVAWILGTALPGSARPTRAPAALSSLVVAIIAALSLARIASFRARVHRPTLDSIETAVRLDPGDLDLRLFVAETEVEAARCDRARVHLDALARLAPSPPIAAALGARCARKSH